MGAVHNFQLDMSWPKKKVKRQKLSDEPTSELAKNGDEKMIGHTKYYLLTVLDSTMMMLFDECIGVIVAAAKNKRATTRVSSLNYLVSALFLLVVLRKHFFIANTRSDSDR